MNVDLLELKEKSDLNLNESDPALTIEKASEVTKGSTPGFYENYYFRW